MKTQSPKYDKVQKDSARYAENLANLLWRKVAQTLTQDQQELLLQCIAVGEMVAAVIPEELEKVEYSPERIDRMIERAEALLIGVPQTDQARGVQWEDFQTAAKPDQADVSCA